MNVDLLEWSRIKNFSISDAIKSHAAGKTNGFESCSLARLFQHAQINLFEPRLQRTSKVAVPVLQRFFGGAHRTQALRHFI